MNETQIQHKEDRDQIMFEDDCEPHPDLIKISKPVGSQNTPETLRILYVENAKIATVFWEWRNKNLTSFFIGIGALFSLASWFYSSSNFNDWICVPLFLAALLSLVLLFLNWRIQDILAETYEHGETLEALLIKQNLIFSSLKEGHGSWLTFSFVHTTVFSVSSLLFVILMVYAIFRFGSPLS